MEGVNWEHVAWPWEYHNCPDTMGGFAHKLMAAWYHADLGNKERIRRGFPWVAIGAFDLYFMGHFVSWEEYSQSIAERYGGGDEGTRTD